MYAEALMLIGAAVALIVLFALTLETLHIYGLYRVLYGLDWERQELRCPKTDRLTSVQNGAGNRAISSLHLPKTRTHWDWTNNTFGMHGLVRGDLRCKATEYLNTS
jgi:hypothetical protein